MKRVLTTAAIVFALLAIAIIVGVNKHPDPQWPSTDSQKMHAILNSKRCDVRVVDVTDKLPAKIKAHVCDQIAVAANPKVGAIEEHGDTLYPLSVTQVSPPGQTPPVLGYDPSARSVGAMNVFICLNTGDAEIRVFYTYTDHKTHASKTEMKTIQVLVR